MTQIIGSPAKAAVKMNRQQRRQAARKVRKGRKPNGIDVGTGSPADQIIRNLRTAVRSHQAGDLDTAIAIYRRIVERYPDHFDALHLLGLAAYQRGESEVAVGLITRALALCPDNVIALNNLGITLRSQAKYERALACHQRALAIDPNYAPAYRALGATLISHGNPDQAVACLQRAIAIDPGDAETHQNLGVALTKLGRFNEAADCYRRALAIDPENVESHSSLGAVLTKQGKADEAVMHCQRALAIDAGNAEAHNNLGSALKSKGLFAEAALEYEAALAIEPDYALAIKNLADTSKIQPDDPLIPRIEQLLRSEALPVERREQCHFALGKCLNDVGTYDKAFEQYRAGNEIKKERHSFDAGAYARETDRLMATFDRAFFEQRNSHGSNSERPIFIVGMPRSGTTLVEQIIASHPDVFGAGELPHFNRLVKNLPARLRDAAYPECVAGIDPKTASQLADEYLGYLRSLSPDAPQVTDKLPQNFRHLGLITLLLPHARIISCRREPLDVCLSCYFQDFFAQPFSHDLADIGRFYREYDRLMAHWISVLPLPILEVQYEDLVGDMEAVSRRMISFCGLNWDDACLAFHKHERPVQTASDWQVRQPIYRTSVERWRRYEKHLEPLKQVLTGTL